MAVTGLAAGLAFRIRCRIPWIVRPFTNQETPNAKTATASMMNSNGQCALTEADSRFVSAARITQDKIVTPLTR